MSKEFRNNPDRPNNPGRPTGTPDGSPLGGSDQVNNGVPTPYLSIPKNPNTGAEWKDQMSQVGREMKGVGSAVGSYVQELPGTSKQQLKNEWNGAVQLDRALTDIFLTKPFDWIVEKGGDIKEAAGVAKDEIADGSRRKYDKYTNDLEQGTNSARAKTGVVIGAGAAAAAIIYAMPDGEPADKPPEIVHTGPGIVNVETQPCENGGLGKHEIICYLGPDGKDGKVVGTADIAPMSGGESYFSARSTYDSPKQVETPNNAQKFLESGGPDNPNSKMTVPLIGKSDKNPSGYEVEVTKHLEEKGQPDYTARITTEPIEPHN